MSEDSWEAVWLELSDGGRGAVGGGWRESILSPLPSPAPPPILFESKFQPFSNFIHRYFSLHP